MLGRLVLVQVVLLVGVSMALPPAPRLASGYWSNSGSSSSGSGGYYDCSPLSSNPDACAQNPECGYCCATQICFRLSMGSQNCPSPVMTQGQPTDMCSCETLPADCNICTAASWCMYCPNVGC